MPIRSLLSFALLASGCLFSSLSEAQTLTSADKVNKIPFQLTPYNNLSIRAVLNNKDTVQLMFHTASSEVTLTEEATAKLQSLHWNNTDTVKSWGGESNTSRSGTGNTLQIGNMHWKDIMVSENKNSGQGTDGKFGPDLFKDKVVEIDFDKEELVIYNSLPAKVKKYEKLKLTAEGDMMFIEAHCFTGKDTLANRFLVHTGYGGSVLLDDEFANKYKLGEKLTITGEKSLKDSYGNVLKTKKAIMPFFILGHQTLKAVPVGFFEGAIGRQKMSVIGGDLLKRFNWVIDAQRQFVYVRANQLAGSAYSNS